MDDRYGKYGPPEPQVSMKEFILLVVAPGVIGAGLLYVHIYHGWFQ